MTAERRDGGTVDPPYLWPDYQSTLLRAPLRRPLTVPYSPTELSGPSATALVQGRPGGADPADLTRQHTGEPLGERIIVAGRVLDAAGRPLPHTLVEIWQTNAAGRYAHQWDQHPAPLDPSFTGAGWCLTDGEGRYRFVTIKPAAYPWRNQPNAWRPAHIHFSLFGRAFSQRLVTQMYFPGDPLLEHDVIFRSVPDEEARQRLVAQLDLPQSAPEWALAYRFDVVLGGREGTPSDGEEPAP